MEQFILFMLNLVLLHLYSVVSVLFPFSFSYLLLRTHFSVDLLLLLSAVLFSFLTLQPLRSSLFLSLVLHLSFSPLCYSFENSSPPRSVYICVALAITRVISLSPHSNFFPSTSFLSKSRFSLSYAILVFSP